MFHGCVRRSPAVHRGEELLRAVEVHLFGDLPILDARRERQAVQNRHLKNGQRYNEGWGDFGIMVRYYTWYNHVLIHTNIIYIMYSNYILYIYIHTYIYIYIYQ